MVHEVLKGRFQEVGIRRGIEDVIRRVVGIGARRAAGTEIGKGAGTREEIEIITGNGTVTERGNDLIEQIGEEVGVMMTVPETRVVIGSLIP